MMPMVLDIPQGIDVIVLSGAACDVRDLTGINDVLQSRGTL